MVLVIGCRSTCCQRRNHKTLILPGSLCHLRKWFGQQKMWETIASPSHFCEQIQACLCRLQHSWSGTSDFGILSFIHSHDQIHRIQTLDLQRHSTLTCNSVCPLPLRDSSRLANPEYNYPQSSTSTSFIPGLFIPVIRFNYCSIKEDVRLQSVQLLCPLPVSSLMSWAKAFSTGNHWFQCLSSGCHSQPTDSWIPVFTQCKQHLRATC